MTSFTKLKCRWTSVLALSLPSKLNLILFYYYVTFRYEVKFGHLIFCMTLSTELFKTIMAWITEDLKSTDTLRLQGLKKYEYGMFKVLCDKTDNVQSVKEGGFITEVIVNDLILLLQWAISWFLEHQVETIDWFMEGSTRLWTWPFFKKKKKSDCSLYAFSVTDSKLCNWSVRPKKHFKH